MPKTTNLGLNLTTDDTTKVKDWRNAIDGQGTEEEGNLSNMQIVDKEIGKVNDVLDILNGESYGGLEQLINGTIVSYTNNNLSFIKGYVFQSCSLLQNVSFGMCKEIEQNAFAYCSNLQEANFPLCTSIGSSAFGNCSSLQEVSFPMCSSIGSGAFMYCSSLQEVNLPVCSVIGFNVFASCKFEQY